jgi:acetoin utilization deacetylase AcuC-like enzyme
MLAMPVVWDERCRLHEPGSEIWIGVRTPATETPARADAILGALADLGARVVPAEPHDDAVLLAVHDAAFVEYLSSMWDEWKLAGLPDDPGQDRVVPYIFPHPGLAAGATLASPVAAWARPGYYIYDTMTLVGPGTWEAARCAVDAALTAADLVIRGAPFVYACCRPPGHHACRGCCGGSCYLNNAAVAAEALRQRAARVGVLDLDAHHGNGTQEIFWERQDVLVASVHVDPGAGWFPHFLGFADETGGGGNLNLPLPPGAGDKDWLDAIVSATEWVRDADALVVPLGVDAAAGDPESPLRVSPAGFREAGRMIGALGLPTVLVQEGGYDLDALGPLVGEVLLGIEEASRPGQPL